MHLIDGAGHVNNRFVTEDPAINRPPTEITADIMNALVDELVSVIIWSGLELNKLDNTQLLQALQLKFASLSPSGDYATKSAVQQDDYTNAVASVAQSTNNLVVAAFVPAIDSLTGCNGMVLSVKTAVEVNVVDPSFTPHLGTVTAKLIVKGNNLPLDIGDLPINYWADFKYDDVLDRWVLLNPATGVMSGASGNFAGQSSSSASVALTLADMGKMFMFTGSTPGQILTLPPVAAVQKGKNAIIVNQATASVTVKGNASENLAFNAAGVGRALANSFVLHPGDSIILSSNAVNQWNAFGYTSNGQFQKSLGASGYLKIPGGLIIQWGLLSNLTSNLEGMTAFPVSFPTACVHVSANQYSEDGARTSVDNQLQVYGKTNSLFSWYSNDSGGVTGAMSYLWFALGY